MTAKHPARPGELRGGEGGHEEELDEGRDKLRRTGQKVVEEAATRLEHGIESGTQKSEQALSG